MLSRGEELLRQYTSVLLPHFSVEYNYRPAWLNGLELDMYFPDEKVGIEFNGDQHYINTKKYGSPQEQNARDKEKAKLCRKNKVRLVVLEAVDLRASRIREICQSIVLIAHFNGKHRETHQESIGRQHIKELRLLDIEADKYRSRLIASFNSMTALERDDKKRRAAQKKALRVYADPGVKIDPKERLKMAQKNWR